MSYIRVLLRRPAKWPVVVPMYQLRQCPDCGALVRGAEGQQLHQEYHDQANDVDAEETGPPPLDGYVIGSGALPESMRGGED